MKRNTFLNIRADKNGSIDYLKGILLDARTATIERVQDIEKEELHWQYAEGWNSVAALLTHISSVETFFSIKYMENRKLLKEEVLALLPGLELGKYLAEMPKDKEVDYYLSQLEESRRLLMDRIDELDFHRFTEKISDYNPETGSNLVWILYHQAEDEIHHKGQISLIRKLYHEIQKNKT